MSVHVYHYIYMEPAMETAFDIHYVLQKNIKIQLNYIFSMVTMATII